MADTEDLIQFRQHMETAKAHIERAEGLFARFEQFIERAEPLLAHVEATLPASEESASDPEAERPQPTSEGEATPAAEGLDAATVVEPSAQERPAPDSAQAAEPTPAA